MLTAPAALTAPHHVADFQCGKPALDHWLKHRALRNQAKGFTAVMVVFDQQRVVGYYGLAPTAVTPNSLPRGIRSGQPPDPVPCLLLGQLAVDQRYTGHGIGNGLLQHALMRCLQAANLIGGRALMANALDQQAASYWQRRGFLSTRDDPLTLFRSIADIRISARAHSKSQVRVQELRSYAFGKLAP